MLELKPRRKLLSGAAIIAAIVALGIGQSVLQDKAEAQRQKMRDQRLRMMLTHEGVGDTAQQDAVIDCLNQQEAARAPLQEVFQRLGRLLQLPSAVRRLRRRSRQRHVGRALESDRAQRRSFPALLVLQPREVNDDRPRRQLKERTGKHYCIECLKEVPAEEYFGNDHVCD